jgi:electron transfer flavoprotein beta subunit
MKAKKKPIEVLTAESIGADKDQVGLPGSRTQVVKVYTPTLRSGGGKILNTDDLQGSVAQLIELIPKRKESNNE